LQSGERLSFDKNQASGLREVAPKVLHVVRFMRDFQSSMA
jgi:hypothetical protein